MTPSPAPSSSRRFGRAAVAAVAVVLLGVGGIGGFAIGRATTGTDVPDQLPGVEDGQAPPGFENGMPPDLRGGPDGDGGGPGFGDQNDGQDGGTGT